MASDADRWRTAIYIVEQSGIADLLARWRAEDRGDKRPGPTPWLKETQVFTLFLILTLHRRPPLFTEMAAMLYHADQSLLDLLGVVKSDASETALFHRAYNTYHESLVPLLNPEPESLYRLMLKGDYAALVAERDVEDCQKRWERSITFTAALIWGCWMLLPREHRRKTTVDVVIDATHMASPGRGRGARSKYVSSDPTCGWYKRDGDHDGSQGAPATSRAKTRFKRTADELVWAREFTLLALCLPGLPRIVVGALLDQPGKRIAQNTLTLIDLLLAQGFTIEHFIGDMGHGLPARLQDGGTRATAASPWHQRCVRVPEGQDRPGPPRQPRGRDSGRGHVVLALPCPKTSSTPQPTTSSEPRAIPDASPPKSTKRAWYSAAATN